MFNLLLPEHKQELRRLYRLRLTLMAMGFSVAILLLVLIALVPAFLLSHSKTSVLEQSITTTTEQSSLADIQKNITMAKAIIARFPMSTTTPAFAERITEVAQAKSADVRITSFSAVASTEEGEPHLIRVSGVATTRESLRSFEAALKALPRTQSIDIPVSVFAKSRDLAFTIDIAIR
jgi:hypothetical protein